MSMLNLDFKIITKISANRLNKFTESVVHTDQMGFIPNLHSFFNTRRVLNIMYYKFPSASKKAILFLDAEIAFDRVEWGYVFKVLERFGLGDCFVAWVHLAYVSLTALIVTNQDKSQSFSLEKLTLCLSVQIWNLGLCPPLNLMHLEK